jgi:Xaa-Pro aminopeptidase
MATHQPIDGRSAPALFAARRARFFEALGSAAAVIPAAPLAVHHADCEWPFRQNSDFWYLTGFDEPDAVALFLPHRPEGERYVLFVQPREASAEVWHGFRWGTEGAVAHFGADLAHPIEELAQHLAAYLKDAEGIAFRVGKHPKVEPLVIAAWAAQLDRAPRHGRAALGLGGTRSAPACAAAAQESRGTRAPAGGCPHLGRGP